MEGEPLNNAISVSNTVGDWITRFGLATVFASILLAYVLWSSMTLSTAIMPSLDRISATQERLAAAAEANIAVQRELLILVDRSCPPPN